MYTYKNMFEKLEIKYNASICLRDYDNIKLLSVIVESDKFTLNHNFNIDEIGNELFSKIRNDSDDYMKFVNEHVDLVIIMYADDDYNYAYTKPLFINNEEKVKKVFKRYKFKETVDKRKLLSSKDYGMKFIKFTRKENFYAFCHNDIIRTIVNDCY